MEQREVNRAGSLGGDPAPAVMMVSRDPTAWRLVQAVCAAADVDAARTEEWRPADWLGAAAVIVGSDLVEEVRRRQPPRRDRLFVVCAADEVPTVSAFSVEYGAAVVTLPQGSGALTAALADLKASVPSPGRIVAVVGATGGVGASTLAAGLAGVAARESHSVALVDLQVGGGGLDLVLGAERLPGWRWSHLATARGVLQDPTAHLVRVDGIDLLAMDRLTPLSAAPDPEAVRAVVTCLCRGHDLVVVDAGRGRDPLGATALAMAPTALLLVPATVHGLGAARDALHLWDGSAVKPRVLLRRLRGGGLTFDDLEAGLGLLVEATITDDPALLLAAERGEPPVRSARHPFSRTCRELVRSLVGEHKSTTAAGSAVLGTRDQSPQRTVTDPVAQARRALLAVVAEGSSTGVDHVERRRSSAPRRAARVPGVASGTVESPAASWSASTASPGRAPGRWAARSFLPRADVPVPVPGPARNKSATPARVELSADVMTGPLVPDGRRVNEAEAMAPQVMVAGPTVGRDSTRKRPDRPANPDAVATNTRSSPAWTPTNADLDALRARLVERGGAPDPAVVSRLMRDEGWVVSDETLLLTLELLQRDSSGAGPLEPLLRQPGVTDVLVNGPGEVYLDRGAGLERAAVRFSGETEVRRLAQRLAAGVGRRLDEASPFVDARLPDGTRVHAVLAGPAGPHTCLSLRVPARRAFSLEDFQAAGSLSQEGAALLGQVVAARLAFLVSGGTGSGKTTLLATLLGLVHRDERIVVVEDARELRPAHPHVVHLEARPANSEAVGEVTLSELVRNSLRMRPDRLVVGEVRGAEIADLLAALNTGHEGGCGTVHANSAADVPARLEALAALGGMSRPALHSQLASALHAVIHVARDPDGRRRVHGVFLLDRAGPDGLVRVQPAAQFTEEGPLHWGPAGDRLRGLLP